MILAVKRPRLAAGRREVLLGQIAEIKAFYGVREHALETLLEGSATSSATPSIAA